MAIPSGLLNDTGIAYIDTYPSWNVQPAAAGTTWSWSTAATPNYVSVPMDMSGFPPGRPFIARGSHSQLQTLRGVRIGCTMELVSALSGEQWSDHPRTADRRLTQLMILTNDILPDAERQKMLEFVPRLLGTRAAPLDREMLDREIAGWMNTYEGQLYRLRHAMDKGLIDTLDIDFLLRNARQLLDAFDRQLGRAPQKLDDQVLTQLMLALAA